MLLYDSIKMLQAGSHIMKKNIITNISSSSSGLASVSEGKFYFDAKNHVFSIGGITHPDENNKKYMEQLRRIDRYTEQVLYYTRAEHAEKDYLIQECSLAGIIHHIAIKNKDDLLEK